MPSFVARVQFAGRRSEHSFVDLALAVQWAADERIALRDGRGDARVPTLREAATFFLVRARDGKALTRSRRRYARNTLEQYERVLRLHVLPRCEPKQDAPLGDVQADDLDARTLQRLVDGIAEEHGGELARQAHACVSAVLRDLYVRGIVDSLPPAVLLPPPNAGRDRALTPIEANLLLRRRDDAHARASCIRSSRCCSARACASASCSARLGTGGVDLDAATARGRRSRRDEDRRGRALDSARHRDGSNPRGASAGRVASSRWRSRVPEARRQADPTRWCRALAARANRRRSQLGRHHSARPPPHPCNLGSQRWRAHHRARRPARTRRSELHPPPLRPCRRARYRRRRPAHPGSPQVSYWRSTRLRTPGSAVATKRPN